MSTIKFYADSCKTRNEVRSFWESVQDRNISKPPAKKAPEGASCGTCDHFKKLRCKLKKKPVKHYNICGEWFMKPAEFVNLCVNGEITHTVEVTPFESRDV